MLRNDVKVIADKRCCIRNPCELQQIRNGRVARCKLRIVTWISPERECCQIRVSTVVIKH